VCNDGTDPATQNHVLGVMATDIDDLKADFSNYGNAYTMLDVCAPGVDILSTVPGNSYEGPGWSGTSMAAPHAAGVAALVMSQLGSGDAGAVIDQIRITTVDIDSRNPAYAGKLGTGRIDAGSSIGVDLPPGAPTAVNAFDTPGDNGGSITVTWRRSPDDGAGRNDVLGYEVWRGSTSDPTTGNFQKIPGSDLPPGRSSFKDENPPLPNGVNYYYYITCHDAASTVRSTNVAGPAAARDDLAPPAITTLKAVDTPVYGRSITLTWPGYATTKGLASFKVYRAEAAFSDVTTEGVTLVTTINDPEARTYTDTAPAHPRNSPPLDQVDYWYAVTAIDEAGNEITAVTTAGPVRSAPNLNYAFRSGLRMISIPAVPVDPSPMAVFAITDPSQMLFARWDSPTNLYHTLANNPDDPVLRIGPGGGFWLDRSATSYITGGGTPINKGKYEISINQGWNMVGSPYDGDCLFKTIDVKDPYGTTEHITASGNVRHYGWRYDAGGGTYKLLSPVLPGADETLPALEAMWVYAYQPGLKLVFLNPLGSTAVQATERPALDGWQVRLVARTRNAADTENYIGVTSAAASLGKVVSPPPVRGGLDLYLTLGARGADRLAMDLRPSLLAGATWNMAVECLTTDPAVELSWPDLTQVPHDLRPILTDLATGRSVYMRTTTGYRYEPRQVGETRRFRITMQPGTAGPVMTQVAAAPTRAGGAEILYTLHRAAVSVRIAVLNLAGRQVASLGPVTGAAGVNRTVWNGLSATGQRVPAGRYVVRVMATADDGEAASALALLTLGN